MKENEAKGTLKQSINGILQGISIKRKGKDINQASREA